MKKSRKLLSEQRLREIPEFKWYTLFHKGERESGRYHLICRSGKPACNTAFVRIGHVSLAVPSVAYRCLRCEACGKAQKRREQEAASRIADNAKRAAIVQAIQPFAEIEAAYAEDRGAHWGTVVTLLTKEHGLVDHEKLIDVEDQLREAFSSEFTFVVRTGKSLPVNQPLLFQR